MLRIAMSWFLISGLPVVHNAQTLNTGALQQKAITLCRFLEQKHYQPLNWNDSASVKLYEQWLERLDEEKLFFTKQDLAALENQRTFLDDELRGKGWNFFNQSVTLYRKRIQSTDSLVKTLLSKPLEFGSPDKLNWPFSDYAATAPEQARRWQLYLKWKLLDMICSNGDQHPGSLADGFPAGFPELEKKYRERLYRKEKAYLAALLGEPSRYLEERGNEYLSTIAWCYDPHTTYMNRGEKAEFDNETSAMEYSAGFSLRENEKGLLAIVYLKPGGSAWRSGQLHVGDVLVRVGVGTVEKDVEDIDEEELGRLLNSTAGEGFTITVRNAAGELKTVRLSKEKIRDEESVVKSYVIRQGQAIGYINLPGFYSREGESTQFIREANFNGCANDVSREIVKLKKDSIRGLILDLRNNGGGSMWEAMQLAGIFIDIGPLASMREKDGKIHFLKDPNRGTIYDGPLLILLNGGSASASEFVSAALQDYYRALIVGSRTYGKGTAQVVLPLDTVSTKNSENTSDFVKVTTEKFYRVNGETTQWKGVSPDIGLPDVFDNDEFREQRQASALAPDNSRTGIYERLPALPVAWLKALSEKRVAADTGFQVISSFNSWMHSIRDGRSIPLQWAAFTRDYKQLQNRFRALSDDFEKREPMPVVNNRFDGQQQLMISVPDRETNQAYLKRYGLDPVLREANAIMQDWIGR